MRVIDQESRAAVGADVAVAAEHAPVAFVAPLICQLASECLAALPGAPITASLSPGRPDAPGPAVVVYLN